MGHNTFEVTAENFQEEVLGASLPVLVEFGAEWCPPCKMLAPIVDELAKTHQDKLRVGTLDVDEYPELQEIYGVMGIPTMILFQNGTPVKRIVGFTPRNRLEEGILPLLA